MIERSAKGWDGRQIDDWRKWWELVFYCWRWVIVLVPATVEAVAVVVAIFEGRAPTPIVNPFTLR